MEKFPPQNIILKKWKRVIHPIKTEEFFHVRGTMLALDKLGHWT